MKRLIVIASVLTLGLLCFDTAKPVVLPAPNEQPFGAPAPIQNEPISQPRSIAAYERENSGLIVIPEDLDELRDWAREHFDLALAWLPDATAGETRDIVVEMVCARIAVYDPREAVSLAARYPCESCNLAENLVHQWAERHGDEARAYVTSQTPSPERDRFLSRIALVAAKIDPAEAATLVVKWIRPGDIQAEAAISVAHQWALLNADAALAWAASFPEESLRARAMNEVAAASRLAP